MLCCKIQTNSTKKNNMNPTDFSSLNLNSNLLTNLDSLGYKSMTPIQALSLPIILSGKDVIGQGKTGSGKTAAFGLGLLQKLDNTSFKAQALILCPTRELADQVAGEIRKLARAVPNVKVLTLCVVAHQLAYKLSLYPKEHILSLALLDE
jgi:ATP-independent RNA helicase DbpA